MDSQPPAFADDSSGQLRRNVELKVRLDSLEQARRVAGTLSTEYGGVQTQRDTYFDCDSGRLKVREIEGKTSQLIWYARPDQARPRGSEYYLLDVQDPELLKSLLTAALGVRQVVEKCREIFFYHNVRIHLDDVAGLGTFLEFEAVMHAGQDLAAGQQQLEWLCAQFELGSDQFLSQSYGEMTG